MPPKAAEKKPSTGGKAPAAGKAPAEKKEAGKKTATAASGDKKKRGKTRKETYSSYIYKGKPIHPERVFVTRLSDPPFAFRSSQLTCDSSPQAGPPRHWYLYSCHVHPELFRQRYVLALFDR